MQDFIKDLIDEYEIGSNAGQSRVAVVQFSDRAVTEFRFDDYLSNESVKQAIDDTTSYINLDTNIRA